MNQFQFFLGAGALCCEHVGGGGGGGYQGVPD